MKKVSIVSALLITAMLSVVGMQASVQAGWSNDLKSGDSVTVAKGKTHEGSLYVGAETVKIDGTVTGSLYCAGQSVTITGDVQGDIACAGQSLDYSGTAEGSVRLAGQQVTMNGTSGTDTTIFGQAATVGDKAQIGGDLNGGAQALTINGSVAKNLQFGAQSVTINSVIAGDANIGSEKITLGDSAKVNGTLHYAANDELSIDADKVGGKVEYNAIEEGDSETSPLMGIVTAIALMAVTSLLIALIAPRFMERSSTIAKSNFGLTLLIGVAAVFMTPLVGLILVISVVGVPLAIVGMLLYTAMLMLSGVFLAYYLGATLLRTNQNVLLRMLGGVAVLAALWIIPIVNIFAVLATVIVGSGIIVRTVTNGYRTPRYSLSEEPPMPPMPTSLGNDKLEEPKPIAKKQSKPKKPTDKK